MISLGDFVWDSVARSIGVSRYTCTLLTSTRKKANTSSSSQTWEIQMTEFMKHNNQGCRFTGLLGGHKRRLRSGGRKSPRSWSFFCETTRNICVKIQQTTLAVTRVDILNDITSKILGDITMMSPLHKYWEGHVPLSNRDRRPWQLHDQQCQRIWWNQSLST